MFRAAHSLKGMAGTLGYEAEAELAHALEDHLTHMRSDRSAPPETVALLVNAVDALNAAVDAIARTRTGPDLGAVTTRLRDHRPDASAPSAPAPAEPATDHEPGALPDAISKAAHAVPPDERTCLRIRLDRRCVAPKARLLVIQRTLEAAGRIVHMEPPAAAWARLDASSGIQVHVVLQGRLDADALAARVQRIPDVDDAQTVDVPPAAATTAPAAPTPSQEPAAQPLQSSTVRVPVERIDRLLDRAGEVRIALAQLDRLLADHFLGERPYALTEAMLRLEREAKDLHDDALALRTLPVSVITRRFTRLVRDTARQLDKQVRLVIEGEQTEVDRSVLEALADPVMHLVKNAIGHGVEPAAARRAAGKQPAATVAIRFHRVPTGVEVIVSDDGAGIDRHRVVARAIEAGHLASGTDPDTLSEEQVFGLLTRPGFSTAAAVTAVSGRGVGLDVVQERLNAIGGSIRLQSTPGTGTTVRLTLPPTLALVESLECLVDGDPYYVPVDSIVTTLDLKGRVTPDAKVTFRDTRAETAAQQDREHDDGAAGSGPDEDAAAQQVHRTVRVVTLDSVLGVRARRLPYVPAPTSRHAPAEPAARPERAAHTAAEAPPERPHYGVIVEKHGHLACLAVDAFGTIQELVVKAVDLPGGGPRFVSGAAIRSDGRVGLLLDVPSLLGAGLAAVQTTPVSP